MNPAWVAALVALATAVAGLVYWFLRIGWQMFQRVDDFLEDWRGREETRGHPARLGVMERLVKLEENNDVMNKRFDTQDDIINTIKAEVTFNTGHSIKDAVRDILQKVNRLQPPAS